MAEEDLCKIFFHAPDFPLMVSTAIDYLSLSQFYDRESNNEEIFMQFKTRYDKDKLLNMKGVQYEIIESDEQKGIFVIRKLLREDTNKDVSLCYYYILQGKLFQSPTLLSIAKAKLANAIFHLSQTLKHFSTQTAFKPETGRLWKYQVTENLAKNKDAKKDEAEMNIDQRNAETEQQQELGLEIPKEENDDNDEDTFDKELVSRKLLHNIPRINMALHHIKNMPKSNYPTKSKSSIEQVSYAPNRKPYSAHTLPSFGASSNSNSGNESLLGEDLKTDTKRKMKFTPTSIRPTKKPKKR